MSSALSISQAAESKWTVVSGPMKGSVRLLNLPRFSVGRSPECEFVVVNDPKCSRKHAAVACSLDGCEVISLNDSNLVLVNGKEIERARLNDGDIVTFGETEIQYNSTSTHAGGTSEEPEVQLAVVREPQARGGGGASHAYPIPAQEYAAPQPAMAYRPPRRAKNKKPSGGAGRLIIYVVLGLIIFYLASPSPKKKAATALRTEQQIQADIETANKLKESSENASMKRLDTSVTGRQAQENYVRGFRDYKKGQYERSLISFQACLALNPQHVLCNRYLRLGQRKFNEIVQYEIVLGRKYRDQNQFQACRAAFRNVMYMVKDANSPAFKEAKANYEACNALIEGRF